MLAGLVAAVREPLSLQPLRPARLSRPARRLPNQAESQMFPTARAANAGRRLSQDRRCLSPVQVQSRTESFRVGPSRYHSTPNHPANRPGSRLQSPGVEIASAWFDPRCAHRSTRPFVANLRQPAAANGERNGEHSPAARPAPPTAAQRSWCNSATRASTSEAKDTRRTATVSLVLKMPPFTWAISSGSVLGSWPLLLGGSLITLVARGAWWLRGMRR